MMEPYASLAYTLRDRFDPKAFIKLWGCNSALRNWVYSDNGVTDPVDIRGHWTNSAQYKAAVGQWPSGSMVHRLHPDRGEYHAYHP
jgi:hypothetical protein